MQAFFVINAYALFYRSLYILLHDHSAFIDISFLNGLHTSAYSLTQVVDGAHEWLQLLLHLGGGMSISICTFLGYGFHTISYDLPIEVNACAPEMVFVFIEI